MTDKEDTTKAALAALKGNMESDPKKDAAPPPVTTSTASSEASDLKEYKQYTSSRISTCMFTPTGKRINFTNFELYTKDPEIIAYLDSELENGLTGIKAGEMVSVEDINPMAALKRKHIQEFLDSQEGRNYSAAGANTENQAEGTGMVNSSQVAN